jgi:flagellar capping protein FliD
MVSEIAKQKDVQRQDAVNSAVRNTERIQRDFLTNFIDDLIAGGDLALEDSVRQFLTRLLERINTDEQPHERAIRDLVGAYNAAVSQHRSGTAQGLGPSEYVRLEE